MIIEKKLLFEGSLNEKHLLALFDSGATFSCIQPENAAKLGGVESVLHPFTIETAKAGEMIEISEKIILEFYIDQYRFSDEFMVIPDLSEEVIIGASTMQKWRFKLDFEHDKVIIDPRVTRLRLV
ncbi:MAG: hypothetical protein IEMM0008_1275 [bacterium]|nr:MAG: hypothetical protein IEMM0008_1275 [bacterium]